jgi:uncharacterized membrane protein SirB2
VLTRITEHPYFNIAKLLSGVTAIGILFGYSIRFASAEDWLVATIVGLTAITTFGTFVLSIRRDSRKSIGTQLSTGSQDDGGSMYGRANANISGAVPGIIGTVALVLFIVGVVVATAIGQWSAVVPWLGPASMFGVAAMAVRTRQDHWWS